MKSDVAAKPDAPAGDLQSSPDTVGPGRGRWRPYLVLAALVVILPATYAVLGVGRGGLAYFSPDTLEYEIQSEITIFHGTVPVYRSARRAVCNDVVEMLRAEGFVAPVRTDDPSWEPVFHWNYAWRDGRALIYYVLCHYDEAVIEWTLTDRARARIYWGEAFRFLRSPNEVDRLIGREILYFGWRCETIPELRARFDATARSIRELYEQPVP